MDPTDAVDAPPEPIGELSEACVRYVKEALGFELDFSPETLPIVDHYLRECAHDLGAEGVALLAPVAGAYFGEVVRRALGGARWYCAGEEHRRYRLEFERVFLCFNPLGVAAEVISQADEGDWAAHLQLLPEAREAVEGALQQGGEVRLEDYYSFSVRLETLQSVLDVLAGLESAREGPPRTFNSAVYAAATGELLLRGPAS
jgi:hypothetical protein